MVLLPARPPAGRIAGKVVRLRGFSQGKAGPADREWRVPPGFVWPYASRRLFRNGEPRAERFAPRRPWSGSPACSEVVRFAPPGEKIRISAGANRPSTPVATRGASSPNRRFFRGFPRDPSVPRKRKKFWHATCVLLQWVGRSGRREKEGQVSLPAGLRFHGGQLLFCSVSFLLRGKVHD
jgi:hypothetical protein